MEQEITWIYVRNDNLKRNGGPQINNPALEVAHDEIKLSGEIHSEEKPELAPQKKHLLQEDAPEIGLAQRFPKVC